MLLSIEVRFCVLSEFWVLTHFPMKWSMVEHRAFCSLLRLCFISTHWTSSDCQSFLRHAWELDFMLQEVHSRPIWVKKLQTIIHSLYMEIDLHIFCFPEDTSCIYKLSLLLGLVRNFSIFSYWKLLVWVVFKALLDFFFPGILQY